VSEQPECVAVTEIWRGRLWSAVPQLVVERSNDHWITFTPAGAVAAYATSRGIAGRDELSRSERKLLAMETLVYNVIEAPRDLATLTFYTRGSYASINLGWSGLDWDFVGWYVNFETPYIETPHGLRTMDLILDLLIDPAGRPQLKDQEDYVDAIARGILNVPVDLTQEAAHVLRRLDLAQGPFDPTWLTWRPNPAWPTPALPPTLRPGGAAWTAHDLD
jgi:hypothetical protein